MPQDEIAELLKQRSGLDAESVGSATIHRAIRQRMAACGLQRESEYSERVQTSPAELQELIEAVVVPETWFFRDNEAFAALAKWSLSEWLPKHPGQKLRILSAPCSTGEEPYSIAMALLDVGLAPEYFEVDAIDISRRALSRARQAVYGKNSFRGHELDFRERYFSFQGSSYHLASAVREKVRFQYQNLLDLEPAAHSYDVIFSRNILIYFDAATQETVIEKLSALLAESGVLFVGPAEAFLLRRSGLTPIRQPRTFGFRKGADFKNKFKSKASGEVATQRSTPQSTIKSTPRKTERGTTPAAARLQTPRRLAPRAKKPTVKSAVPQVPSPTKSVVSEINLEAVSRLADAGRLAEAAAMCEAYIEKNGVSAAAYYLLGLTRDAMGNHQQAAEYYRKVLYLHPDHSEALMHLAFLLEKQGDEVGARRMRQRAQRVEERNKA